VITDQYKVSYKYDYAGKLVTRELINLDTNDLTEEIFHYLLLKPIIVKKQREVSMLLTWGTEW